MEEKNKKYRIAALEGLCFSPDKNFKKSLLKYQNDPDKEVRDAAVQLFSPTVIEALLSRLADTTLGSWIRVRLLGNKP